MSEDKLVEATQSSHKTLRQFCYKNDIDFDYDVISSSLIEEMLETCDVARKMVVWYRIKPSVATHIIGGSYTLPEPKKPLDILELIHHLDQGSSIREIAKTLDTSQYQVNKAIKEHDLKPNRRKLTNAQYEQLVNDILEDKKCNKELAKHYNISTSMVSHIKGQVTDMPPRKPHGKADPELVSKLHEAGLTQQEIADTTGVSQATVSRLLK